MFITNMLMFISINTTTSLTWAAVAQTLLLKEKIQTSRIQTGFTDP